MKSKKILTILLSLAIMFTFMPAMAFAYQGEQTWNDGYASGTYDSDGNGAITYSATRSWSASDGVITAQLGTPAAAGQAAANVGTPKYFIDLNEAFVGYGGKKYDTWTYETFAQNYNSTTGVVGANYDLVLTQPQYTFAKNQTEADTVTLSTENSTYNKYVGSHNSKCFTVEVIAEGFTPDKYEEQTVILHTTVTGGNSTYAGMLYGNVPDQTIKVSAKKPLASDVKVYVDGDSKKPEVLSGNVTLTYDGDTHKLGATSVPGYDVKYTVQNPKTKAYEPKEEVEFRNVGTTNVRITVLDSKTGKPVTGLTDVKRTITINRDTSKVPTFGFMTIAQIERYDYELTPEQAADPTKFVELKAKSSFKSDEEELMNYFNDFYEVKVVKTASNENLQIWTIVEKDNDAKTVAELEKKYETLLGNYAKPVIAEDSSVNVKVDASAEINTKTDDITFSGVTKKTYKAKKSTKKLAKAKSFTVKAVADSGNAIKFSATSTNSKIKINATTGKITVKKGLKKGTYKITVKAKTAAGNGYAACKESKTYTIKVK